MSCMNNIYIETIGCGVNTEISVCINTDLFYLKGNQDFT